VQYVVKTDDEEEPVPVPKAESDGKAPDSQASAH